MPPCIGSTLDYINDSDGIANTRIVAVSCTEGGSPAVQKGVVSIF